MSQINISNYFEESLVSLHLNNCDNTFLYHFIIDKILYTDIFIDISIITK